MQSSVSKVSGISIFGNLESSKTDFVSGSYFEINSSVIFAGRFAFKS